MVSALDFNCRPCELEARLANWQSCARLWFGRFALDPKARELLCSPRLFLEQMRFGSEGSCPPRGAVYGFDLLYKNEGAPRFVVTLCR